MMDGSGGAVLDLHFSGAPAARCGSGGQGWPASQVLGPCLCAQQAPCCLLSLYRDGAVPQRCPESSGGARGTQGAEAECEQCSAVCLCLLNICLLWRHINLENSLKVCVSKAIEWDSF